MITDAGSAEKQEGGSPALTSLVSWERGWSVIDRWGPHLMLAASTVMAVLNPEMSATTRAATLGLVGLAAVWVAAMHTTAPTRRREQPWHAATHLAGVLVLATLLMAQDIVFFLFAITGFLHSALLRPRWLVYVGVAATAIVINTMTWGGFPRPTTEETAGFIALVVIQTLFIGGGIVGGERLTALSEERRRTVQRLEATLAENQGLHDQLVSQAREAGVRDERERMAREIHDTLAQGLTGIITQLGAADQTKHDPEALQRHLDVALQLARQNLDEARRSVHALGPGALEKGRLVDALTDIAADWSVHSGVTIEVSADDAAPPLSAQAEVGLLRVAQEALANVAKHAAASRVGMTLSWVGDQVVLDVRDDGRGFDPTTVASDNGSFGLTSMRQRIAGLGGTLAIESQPEAGTAISATVPTVVTRATDA